MALQGKGFFTNNLQESEGGDPAAIAQMAKSAGLSFVVLKIAAGSQPAGFDLAGKDLLPQTIQALKASGISTWGWHSLSGIDPERQAKLACERTGALGLEGYVVNAEGGFEQPGGESAARQFMAALLDGMKVPIALCSYHFPNFHPNFPWSAFLEGCDLHMPKVFWELAHNPAEQLRESKSQCDALPNARTYIPVGAAYRTIGWAASPEDLTGFLNAACDLGLPAAAFFQWDACRKSLPKGWETVAKFPWPVPAPAFAELPPASAPSDPFAAQFLAGLNSRQPDQMTALYDPAAVRTWMGETHHGLVEIRQAYAALFERLPPAMDFSMSRCRVDRYMHHLTWSAGSLCGETTLLTRDGMIIQDLTFIAS
jgi:hypothetical protein